MVTINPETQKTRRERLATVITIGASALIHILVIVGGFHFYRWVEEEEQRERLMVVRRVMDTSGETTPRPSGPAAPRRQAPPEGAVKEKGPEPPPETGSLSDERLPAEPSAMEGELPQEETEKETDRVISVVTDLQAATFTIAGPAEYNGAGTFWTRKGVPEGKYTATFHPVAGYKTPPIQTKSLQQQASLVFVGKYSKSVEIKVMLNDVPGATFEIQRPDGLKIGMNTPGRAFFEDLPPGNYTIVFHDVAGYLTPAPQTRTLSKGGGGIDFVGTYLPGGAGGGRGRGTEAPKAAATLDRRVQMVVKSYPPTSIEENFDYISYPEIIIKRSNFQRGWCRVYLVLSLDSRGTIERIAIERPKPDERNQYRQLIATVESAVKRWRYETQSAEVHVDVRFYVE